MKGGRANMNPLTTDRRVWLLMAVFAAVQLALFWRTGIVTTLEAEKYIREGTLLAQGSGLSESRFIFYLPVIVLVAVCRLLHIPLAGVVLVQVLAAGWALYAFYKTALALLTPKMAIGISLLLAVFVPLQQWNMYVYSDSLFISLSVIFIAFLFRIANGKTYPVWLIPVMAQVWCFARPAGLLFVLPVFVVLFMLKKNRRWYLAVSLIGLFGALFAAAAYFNGGGDLDTLKPYIEEHIICFVPEKPEGAALNLVHTQNQLNDLFYYILHNPGHFASLFIQKLVSFFNLARPWYSLPHNLALIGLMLPLYLFFLPGMVRLFRTHRVFAWFVVAVLVIYPAGVALQCNDWHGRFTMPLIPLLLLVAAYGAEQLLKKKNAPVI